MIIRGPHPDRGDPRRPHRHRRHRDPLPAINKVTLVERIAELARDKKIEGISHVQDESDRSGVRVVVELRRDATPDVVLNQLFRFTPL